MGQGTRGRKSTCYRKQSGAGSALQPQPPRNPVGRMVAPADRVAAYFSVVTGYVFRHDCAVHRPVSVILASNRVPQAWTAVQIAPRVQ